MANNKKYSKLNLMVKTVKMISITITNDEQTIRNLLKLVGNYRDFNTIVRKIIVIMQLLNKYNPEVVIFF